MAVELDSGALPAGYYWSKNFVGSVIGACLLAISLQLGYMLVSTSILLLLILCLFELMHIIACMI